MESSTKYCLAAIIIATIWLLGQPIGGDISIEANFEKVPYFNLTNSTIGGSAEVSGYMPIGVILPMFIAEMWSTINSDDVLIIYFLVLASSFLTFVLYAILKEK